MRSIGRLVILIIGFLLLWQLIVQVFHLPPYLLPSPWVTFKTLYHYRLLILHQAVPTIVEACVGFVCGAILGCLAAMTLAVFRHARLWFLPILVVSQALPTFAIAPLLVVWLGYGEASKIAVCMLMLFFPVASALYDGLRQTPQDHLDLAKTLGASPWRLFYHIVLPFALPSLASGLRVAATFAPMGAIIGEWVGASRGLGFLMLNANARMQIDMMFAVLIVVVLFTLIFYYCIDFVLKSTINWQRET